MNIKAYMQKSESIEAEDGVKTLVSLGALLSPQEFKALVAALGGDGTITLEVKK